MLAFALAIRHPICFRHARVTAAGRKSDRRLPMRLSVPAWLVRMRQRWRLRIHCRSATDAPTAQTYWLRRLASGHNRKQKRPSAVPKSSKAQNNRRDRRRCCSADHHSAPGRQPLALPDRGLFRTYSRLHTKVFRTLPTEHEPPQIIRLTYLRLRYTSNVEPVNAEFGSSIHFFRCCYQSLMTRKSQPGCRFAAHCSALSHSIHIDPTGVDSKCGGGCHCVDVKIKT